jgi:hypothetical protein
LDLWHPARRNESASNIRALLERISEGGAPRRLKKLRTLATWIDNVDCKMDAAVKTSSVHQRKVDVKRRVKSRIMSIT